MNTEIQSFVKYTDITDNEVEFYNKQGYLVLPGFIDPDAIAQLKEDILCVLETQGVNRDELNTAKCTADKLRQFHKYVKGSSLDAMINDPNTLSVASRLINGEAVRYLPFTAVKAGGGGGQFHFHQDNNYTQHLPASGSLNIWVALVDMTPENGCLQVVPASHLDGVLDWANAGDGDAHRKTVVDPKSHFPVRMRAGDAIAFSRLTVHGSGPNHTVEPRFAYALQYHREDVEYVDDESGKQLRLVDQPRFGTEPCNSYDEM